MRSALIFVLLLPLALVANSGCRGRMKQADVLILDYDAFGPPVIAHELLGPEWWQWQPHGDSRPRKYKVKVVVYGSIPKAEVERRYPVDRTKEQDFRYVSKQAGVEYLDKNIEDAPVDSVRQRLLETRAAIARFFSSP